MRLALECPTKLLDTIQPLADYDFILTHLVLKDREYAEYYKKSCRFKILDNSCNELACPCSLGDIEKAAIHVRPDLIMAPDFLGDSYSTRCALKQMIYGGSSSNIFPIVQGKDVEDVTACAAYIRSLGFTRVAIPYDITCSREDPTLKMEIARKKLVLVIHKLGFNYIHLLGMNTLGELYAYRELPWVKTIDTGFPVMCGMQGRKFGIDRLPDKKIPTLEVMELEDSPNLENVYYNLSFMRKAMNSEA